MKERERDTHRVKPTTDYEINIIYPRLGQLLGFVEKREEGRKGKGEVDSNRGLWDLQLASTQIVELLSVLSSGIKRIAYE